jgi:hypothetical protein
MVNLCREQGNHIVRIFAFWVVVFLGQFFENLKKVAQILGQLFSSVGTSYV